METNTHALRQPGAEPGFADKLRHSKALIPTIAVLGVTTLALAAALVVNNSRAQNGAAGVPVVATPVTQVTPVGQQPAQTVPAARVQPPVPVAQVDRPPIQQPAYREPVYREPVVVARAPACVNCGVVESSTAVQRKGQVDGIGNTQIGVGAIGGAVVGGLLGNQIGKGNGRTAATVLGAAGGGYAGNAIEKNMKKTTVYEVRVRMRDGSYRTIEQSAPVAEGAQVVIEGGRVRAAGAQTSAS